PGDEGVEKLTPTQHRGQCAENCTRFRVRLSSNTLTVNCRIGPLHSLTGWVRRPSVLQDVQFRQHFPTVLEWIHAGIRLRHLARGIDQKCMPRRKLYQSKISQRSIRVRDSVI